MSRSTACTILVGLCLLAGACLLTADTGGETTGGHWPNFRGVNRDGKSQDTGLLKEWPEGGPPLAWSFDDLGWGYSSVTVVDGKVFASGVKDGTLTLYAFGESDGTKLWEQEVGPGHVSKKYQGARSTPTYSDGRLYVLSGNGLLACHQASDGKQLWTKQVTEYGGKTPHWKFAESPLIVDDKVIITPGGQSLMVALNKKTGEEIWQAERYSGPHYCSPILVEQDGVKMIVQGTANGLVAVDPSDGTRIWADASIPKNTANCPSPVYADGHVFWAVGYGKGGVCLKLQSAEGEDGKKTVTAKPVYQTKDMVCHHGGYVVHDGYVYGNHNNGWTCLKLDSGETMWHAKGVGKGSVCFADGMLYLFGERGGLVGLAPATPEGLELVGSFRVKGKAESWAHPVVTGGRLYLRYADNLYCYDVRKK